MALDGGQYQQHLNVDFTDYVSLKKFQIRQILVEIKLFEIYALFNCEFVYTNKMLLFKLMDRFGAPAPCDWALPGF